MQRWKEEIKTNFSGQSVCSKNWWSGVKQQNGLSTNSAIPPFIRNDRSVAIRDNDKAELLAAHFSSEMSVLYPLRVPSELPSLIRASPENPTVTTEQVKSLLLQTDPKKTQGPDNISPHILRRCAGQLAPSLTTILSSILSTSKWPTFWEKSKSGCHTEEKQQTRPKEPPSNILLSNIGKNL